MYAALSWSSMAASLIVTLIAPNGRKIHVDGVASICRERPAATAWLLLRFEAGHTSDV